MELANWANETSVSEIMVENILTLSPNDSLATAAEKLLREQISGAPVVDDSGRCVGVLAMSDLTRAEGKPAEQQQTTQNRFFDFGMTLPSREDTTRLEQFRDKVLVASERSVGHFMTTDLVNVRSDATLAAVVRYIIDSHVHRVLVLDKDEHIKGIVSTIDILAALKRAIQ